MDNEQIKKYLANELSPPERNAFEQEMENDPFLMEAIEGLTMSNSSWTMPELNQKESALYSDINAQLNKKETGKIVAMPFFRYAAAASIIGILALVSWRLFLAPKAIDEQAVYAAYFHPLTHPDGIIRGAQSQTDEAAAIQAYESEDYFAAIKYYEKLVSNNPVNVKNNLFLGVSLLATNQPKKAIEVLSKFTASEEYHADIEWYLALAYLKNKDLQQAQIIFTALAKEDSYYQTQSVEILNKLDGKLASAK
ncbi:MAG: hypothetical protein U0T31_05515 [Chitinophagales bacterium]|nr:hypothetical protein [Chitinophagales bacterium]